MNIKELVFCKRTYRFINTTNNINIKPYNAVVQFCLNADPGISGVIFNTTTEPGLHAMIYDFQKSCDISIGPHIVNSCIFTEKNPLFLGAIKFTDIKCKSGVKATGIFVGDAFNDDFMMNDLYYEDDNMMIKEGWVKRLYK